MKLRGFARWLVLGFTMSCLAGVTWGQTATVVVTTPTSGYLPGGGTVTLTVAITYSVSPTALGGTISLPAGWSLAGTGGANPPNSVPEPGTTQQLDFAYFNFPAGSAQFTVNLNYPAGLVGSQTILSTFQYRTPTQDITPAPVVLHPALSTFRAVPHQTLSRGVAAASFTPVTAAGGTPPYGFAIAPALPASLAFDTMSGAISGTPAASFNATTYTITVTDSAGLSANGAFDLAVADGLVITGQPVSANVAAGGAVVLTVTTAGAAASGYQWRRNGIDLAGANGASLALNNFQVADAGAYSVVVTGVGGAVTSREAVIGVTSTAKVAGSAMVAIGGEDIVHPNGNVYDQILLTGAAATITADPGQITRISYIDLNDDIVQVEFSGAGTLTLTLENASGPAAPMKYNQPGIAYMKGHASLVLGGVDETSNVTVFSVGTGTAVNQGLFPDGVSYDGIADIGLLSIASADGRFGGIRTANAAYFRTSGRTGVYAPGVAVQGPTFIGDITADANATAAMVFGSTTDVRITGGDLLQANGRPVEVDGIAKVAFTAGEKSNRQVLPAQANQGRLDRNGVDVTGNLVP